MLLIVARQTGVAPYGVAAAVCDSKLRLAKKEK